MGDNMRTVFLLCIAALCATAVSATNEEGTKYLEANKAKEGVVTLPSGLQYKVLREGGGTAHPTVDSSCECHYEGTLIDGTEFDSSYKRGSPTSFAPNQVIKGWTEAMQLMVEGDKWQMYIPSELGYGDGGSGAKIKGGDVLIFNMEILKINGESKAAERCDVESLKGCSDKAKAYIEKQKANGADKMKAELKRLDGMKGGDMKEEKKNWILSRIGLLKKLTKDEL